MKTYLKIKICSLAAEAKIIKCEERKWFKFIGTKQIPGKAVDGVIPYTTKNIYKKDHPLRMGLRQHRIDVVRPECRHSNIAYGYMRGRAYKQIENKCYVQPNWERVAEIVRKFSGAKYIAEGLRKQLFEDLKAWSEGKINSKPGLFKQLTNLVTNAMA